MKLANPLRVCSVEEPLRGLRWDQTQERSSVSGSQELVSCKQEGGRPHWCLCVGSLRSPDWSRRKAWGQQHKQTTAGHSTARREGTAELGDGGSHTHKPVQPREACAPSTQKCHKTPSFYKKDNIHCY